MVTPEQAVRACRRWQRAGRTVVLTNGCFDLLHVGHVRYLTQARALGRLIVAVNSDDSTRRLKGPARPIVPEAERAELLASLRCVDLVTIFDDDTAEAILEAVRPDVYAKGADYGSAGKALPEAAVAGRIGARVELIPLAENHSTTSLIQAIRRRFP